MDGDDDRIQDGVQELTMTMGRAALPATCNVRLVGSLEWAWMVVSSAFTLHIPSYLATYMYSSTLT